MKNINYLYVVAICLMLSASSSFAKSITIAHEVKGKYLKTLLERYQKICIDKDGKISNKIIIEENKKHEIIEFSCDKEARRISKMLEEIKPKEKLKDEKFLDKNACNLSDSKNMLPAVTLPDSLNQILFSAQNEQSCHKQSFSECYSDYLCNIIRSVGVIPINRLDGSCLSSEKGSCLSEVLAGVINTLVSDTKSLWELTKMIGRAGKSMAIGAWSMFTKIEDKTSDSTLAASLQSESSINLFKKNPYQFLKDFVSGLLKMFTDSIKTNFACQKWSGTPHLSTCLKPLQNWDCITCNEQVNILCGIAGKLGAYGVEFLLAGSATAGVKWLAKKSLSKLTAIDDFLVKSFPVIKKTEETLGKVGTAVSNTTSKLAANVSFINEQLLNSKTVKIIEEYLAKMTTPIGHASTMLLTSKPAIIIHQVVDKTTYPIRAYYNFLQKSNSLGFEMTEKFLNGKTENTLSIARSIKPDLGDIDQNDFKQLLASPKLSDIDKDDFVKVIQNLQLSKEEILSVIDKINDLPLSGLQKNRLKNYLNYIQTLKKSEKALALTQMNESILDTGHTSGGFAEKFLKNEKKFDTFENTLQKWEYHRLKFKGASSEEAALKAANKAQLMRLGFEQRLYSCLAQELSPDQIIAKERFHKFAQIFSFANTNYTYAKTNSDKFNQGQNEQWFGELGYEIAMSYLTTKLNASIATAPHQTVLETYLQSNIKNAKLNLIDTFVYSNIYGTTHAEAEKRVNEMFNNPNLKSELQILDKYLDKINFVGNFHEAILRNFDSLVRSPEKDIILGEPPYKIGDIVFATLTPEELKKPEIKEKLIQAVVKQINGGNMNALIATGDKGLDRYMANVAWGAIIASPRSLIVNKSLYGLFCLTNNNPIVGVALGMAFQTTVTLINASIYAQYRKTLIGH